MNYKSKYTITFIAGLAFLLFLLVPAIASTANIQTVKKIHRWQNKQIKLTNELVKNNNSYFISLGFASHTSLDTARNLAKYNAAFELPQVVYTYVQTAISIKDELFGANDQGNDVSEIINIISTYSEINVRKIKYKELNYFFIKGIYYVAVNVMISKQEYFNDPVQYKQYTNSPVFANFNEKVDEAFSKVNHERLVNKYE